MRRTRSGQELTAKQFRTGLTSLPGWPVLAGERALCFRALAQQRRMLRQSVIGVVTGLAIALVLLVIAPSFTWAPAVLLLVVTVLGAGSQGLAVELDHYHLQLAPWRPMPALIWVGAAPVAVSAVQIEVVWLPVLAAPDVATGAWVAGAVLIPCLIALAEAAGSLAVVVADGLLARVALTAALVTFGALPATALLFGAVSVGVQRVLVALAAVALLAAATCWMVWTAHRIWPRWWASPRPDVTGQPAQ